MNYKDVIIPDKVEQYIELHKLFYRTLSSMIFDVSFIEACSRLQSINRDIDSDWISVKFLYRNVYENLIIKTSRCFFDTSGSDAVNIFKFKNMVVSMLIKEEYKVSLISEIASLPIEDKLYKKGLDDLKQNVLGLRDQYIAHGLVFKQSDELEVKLKDIKELLYRGCQLFQVLSFDNSLDFYSQIEGDGYDFNEEFLYTKESTELFIKYSMLSSRQIKRISCEYDELVAEKEVKAISTLVNDINNEKSEYKKKQFERLARCKEYRATAK